MSHAMVLGQRALREGIRTPEAIVPTIFIPLFFLVVNVGQAAKIFPSASTEFLNGQGYGAFQLPSSLLLAASFGTAALFLVEEIEGGYFDKLRAAPVPRSAIVFGRLIAEFVAAAERVFSAISCMNPTYTTAHIAVSATSRMKPSTPDAIEIPKMIPSTMIAIVISTDFTPSPISRPSTSDVREIGVARSLSK